MGIIGYKPGNESYSTVKGHVREAFARVGFKFVFLSSVHQVEPEIDHHYRDLCWRVLGIPESTHMRIWAHMGDGYTYYIVDHHHIWTGREYDFRGAITDIMIEVEDDTKLMMLKLILP